MSRKLVGVSVGVVTVLLAFVGPAIAKPLPPPVVVVHSLVAATPQMLVDSKGTKNVLWGTLHGHDMDGDPYPVVRYAREPKGAKHYTQVTLPYVFDPQNPMIYQPSPGVLEILVNGFAHNAPGGPSNFEGAFAFRSTNDGKSWTRFEGTALNNSTVTGDGIYIYEQNMFVAPGGPITYAGSDGSSGPVVQVTNDLSSFKTVATVPDTLDARYLAMSKHGTVFVAEGTDAEGIPTELGFQAGSHDGVMNFPTCKYPDYQSTLAAGKTLGVVAVAGCGHTWVRTVSPSGKVGRMVKIGPATSDEPWVSVVAATNGDLTIAWTEPGGDMGVSRSSTGSHWKTVHGAVPIAQYGSGGTISTGVASWYLFGTGNNESYDDHTQIRALPLSEIYRTPKPPSAHGIPDPHRGRFGSLAVTVPGKIALKHWRKTGKVTLRLVDALTTKIPVSVSDTRVKGDTTYDVCDGGSNAKLTAHHPRTITVSCSSGVIVIGGSAGSGIDAHKGDHVVFTFGGRNPGLTVNARVA